MFDHVVKKAFNIVNRRLQPGDIVTEADDLHPFTLDERVESGFLEVKRDEIVIDAAPIDAIASPVRTRGPGRSADATE